jgi:hypothetical protein
VDHGSNQNPDTPAPAAPAERPSILSREAGWQWIWGTGLAVAYVALEWISFMHESKGLPLTPWNPGLGLAFACLVLGGPAYAIALFAGVIIAEIVVLRSTLGWPAIVAIAAIVAAGFAFVATVIRKEFRLDVGLAHLRDVITLLLAAFVGAVAITLLLAVVLLTGGTLVSAISSRLGPSPSWVMSSASLS